jgi:23S rRNA (cytidine1920-2'-O)/16S rRNA (cytidine1409-2'-O)-methyltransferase
MKIRLDKAIVDRKLASSRTQAQELIEQGYVQVEGYLCQKSNHLVRPDEKIEILQNDQNRFVSRGGWKLEGALNHLGWEAKNLNALDVGISTGGFSDCLLQRGIQFILGVDVGQNQLHAKLFDEPRLKCLEKINARELDKNPSCLELMPKGGWDLVVIDVSFISLALVLPAIFKVCKGRVLALVKPQFELNKESLNRQGLVKDEKSYELVKKKIVETSSALGFQVLDFFESSIAGKDGNREFFIALEVKQS